MPIRVPEALPAQKLLQQENIFVMDSARAAMQDIRPLEVGILNLMPNKIETELQLLRLLSNTPLQINVDLIRIDSCAPKYTPQSHMDAFYTLFDDIAYKQYDGLIITGAPLALMPYSEVKYWDKIAAVFEWTKRHVQSTLYLCWAAHAAMYHFHGVNRNLRKDKLSGVFSHRVPQPHNELVRGFDDTFWAPHSRFGEISSQTYNSIDGLNVLAESPEAGAYLVASSDKRTVLLTGHPEYDPETLSEEYARDTAEGCNPTLPKHYFVDNDPKNKPIVNWRSHGSLLYSNWLNYYVYQNTPYDLNTLSKTGN